MTDTRTVGASYNRLWLQAQGTTGAMRIGLADKFDEREAPGDYALLDREQVVDLVYVLADTLGCEVELTEVSWPVFRQAEVGDLLVGIKDEDGSTRRQVFRVEGSMGDDNPMLQLLVESYTTRAQAWVSTGWTEWRALGY